jgi:hypothetical protein
LEEGGYSSFQRGVSSATIEAGHGRPVLGAWPACRRQPNSGSTGVQATCLPAPPGFRAIEGEAAQPGPTRRRVYRAVWPDPWHPEPPAVEPTDDEDLHYPTPEEIAALEVPSSFRPTRWLGWMLLSLLGFALIMAYAHYLTDVPIEPGDPNAKRIIDSVSKYY